MCDMTIIQFAADPAQNPRNHCNLSLLSHAGNVVGYMPSVVKVASLHLRLENVKFSNYGDWRRCGVSTVLEAAQ
jgi:hypothetical protein